MALVVGGQLSTMAFGTLRRSLGVAHVDARWSVRLGWLALAFLTVVLAPLFVCMPLWPDATLYDLFARNLLAGGRPYHDFLDSNLPGMVWLHLLIRPLVGWSPEALRTVDLTFLAAIVCLLVSGPRRSAAGRAWTAVALAAFYFSTSEHCHCQRDTWMLLPMLAAVALRRRQLRHLTDGHWTRVILAAWVEGLCWAAAVWIKPHALIPALACVLAGVAQVFGSLAARRRLVADLAGLLIGGLLAGALGVAWLHDRGGWDGFVDILLNWNPEYVPAPAYFQRTRGLLTTFAPWGWLHLLAIPVAAVQVVRHRSMLAALYLGWLVQVIGLQHGFAYHYVPLLLLAIALLADNTGVFGLMPRSAVIGVAASALLVQPAFNTDRLALWACCVREGSTVELQDRLALVGNADPSYVFGHGELNRVAAYLRGQDVKAGEVTVFDWRALALYEELGLPPSTPFVMLSVWSQFYPRHREAIWSAVDASPQRFVVTDMTWMGLDANRAAAIGPDGLPPAFPTRLKGLYPWSEPIVFRAGPLAVHRVEGRPKVLERGRDVVMNSPQP
ncbi:MAG: hypothetical protein K2R98_03275 [Gemmataceae bacterium]|nr:hypothetical protein [Gemmataceae bacterium]